MKIEHTAFQVDDPVALAAWYVTHLGLRIKRAQNSSPFGHFLADDGDTVMLEFYNNPRVSVPDYGAMDPLILHIALRADDVPATRRALTRADESIGTLEASEIRDLGKVSLIGAGMRSHPGVAASFFAALAKAGVNIEMISTSEIRISVIVDEAQVDDAVRATHTAFDLDATEVEAVVYGGTGR